MAKHKVPGVKLFSVNPASRDRSRSCTKCRERKRKCSRELPSCSHCLRRNLECHYSLQPRQVDNLKLQEQAEILLGLSVAHKKPSANVGEGNFGFQLVTGEEFAKNALFLSGHKEGSPRSTSDDSTNTAVLSSVLQNSGYSSTSVSEATTTPSIGSFGLGTQLDSAKCIGASDFLRPEKAGIATTQPASMSLWPNHIHEDHLQSFGNDPNVRKGPIYTKIFNSSLNATGSSLEKDMELLSSYVPSKKVADTLFARYINSVHPVMPLFDIQILYPQYEMFWSSTKTAPLSLYIIIFAVLYAGSVSEFEEMSVILSLSHCLQDSVDRMRHLVGATEIALAISDFPAKVTLVGLQASVILHSVIRNDCKTDDCGSVASLIRLAQLIEINRDPQNYHGFSHHLIIQERRLLWWHIYFLDCTTALSSRVPPIVMDGEYDTIMPTEYREDREGIYKLDQSIAFANGRFRWAETCNSISRCSFKLNGISQSIIDSLLQDIEDLGLHCTATILRILDPVNIMPGHENFVKFSSSMLSTFRDRSLCLLNMILATSDSRPETSSTADILLNVFGGSLLKSVLHLVLEFCKHGVMPQNVKFVWEIRKYQPIQALLFLLRSLIGDIKRGNLGNLKELKRDERVLAIEDALDLLGYLSDHTSALCLKRWELVRNLKKITWEQIFNPDIMLSLAGSTPRFPHYENKQESPEAIGEDWDLIIQKLTSVESTINENIFVKQWDESSGRYTM